MKGRTYKFLKEKPLYPFGFGLTYSSFEYSDMEIIEKNDTDISVSVNVTNTGKRPAKEICELYVDTCSAEKLANGLNSSIEDLETVLDPDNQPRFNLIGFKSVELQIGETRKVTFTLGARAFDTVLEDGRRVKLRGTYKLFTGGQQPDERSTELTGKNCLMKEITV